MSPSMLRMIARQDVNRMNAKALSIVFGPNMANTDEDPLVEYEQSKTVTLWLEQLIAWRAARPPK